MLSSKSRSHTCNNKLRYAKIVVNNVMPAFIDSVKNVKIIIYARAASNKKDIHIITIYF